MKVNIPQLIAAPANSANFNMSVRKVGNGLVVDMSLSLQSGGESEQLVIETAGKTPAAVKTALTDALANALITVAEPAP